MGAGSLQKTVPNITKVTILDRRLTTLARQTKLNSVFPLISNRRRKKLTKIRSRIIIGWLKSTRSSYEMESTKIKVTMCHILAKTRLGQVKREISVLCLRICQIGASEFQDPPTLQRCRLGSSLRLRSGVQTHTTCSKSIWESQQSIPKTSIMTCATDRKSKKVKLRESHLSTNSVWPSLVFPGSLAAIEDARKWLRIVRHRARNKKGFLTIIINTLAITTKRPIAKTNTVTILA